jgi:hypothetical protein
MEAGLKRRLGPFARHLGSRVHAFVGCLQGCPTLSAQLFFSPRSARWYKSLEAAVKNAWTHWDPLAAEPA